MNRKLATGLLVFLALTAAACTVSVPNPSVLQTVMLPAGSTIQIPAGSTLILPQGATLQAVLGAAATPGPHY